MSRPNELKPIVNESMLGINNPGSSLKRLLKWIHQKMQKKYDFFICIVGDEGTGKSRGVFLNIMDEWYKECLKKPIPDNCFGVDIKEFIQSLDQGEPMDFRGLDEAGDSLDTQEFTNKFNKLLYQAYTVIREKQYLSVIVLPSFFDLNPRFRKRRVRIVINCKRRIDNTCLKCRYSFCGEVCPSCGSTSYRPGYVAYDVYNRKQIRQILERNQYNMIKTLKVGVQPMMSGIVREYKGEMIEKYSKMKQDKMQKVLQKLTDEVRDLIPKYGVDKKTGKLIAEATCKHNWQYYATKGCWVCRRCLEETTTNPYQLD